MCAFIVGAFLLSILLVGVFHGELSWGVVLVLVVMALSAFGKSSKQEKEKILLDEQLEYYKNKNRENADRNEQNNQNNIDFKRLSIGDTFTIKDISTQTSKKFTIVEKENQDESKGLISNDLPIAIKVANSPIGKNIEMKYGDKIYQFKIMSKS